MDKQKVLSRITGVALSGACVFGATAAFAGEITIWCWDPNFNVAIMKEAGITQLNCSITALRPI